MLEQARVIEMLRQNSEHDQVRALKDELLHARGLIADLQAALQSQEATFAEMLRAQESLRISEEARLAKDRELTVLRADRDHLQKQLREKEVTVQDLREASMRLERKSHEELERVRQAFVDYDRNVGEYVERQRLQHLDEVENLKRRSAMDVEVKKLLGPTAGSTAASPRDANPSRLAPSSAVQPDDLRAALLRLAGVDVAGAAASAPPTGPPATFHPPTPYRGDVAGIPLRTVPESLRLRWRARGRSLRMFSRPLSATSTTRPATARQRLRDRSHGAIGQSCKCHRPSPCSLYILQCPFLCSD